MKILATVILMYHILGYQSGSSDHIEFDNIQQCRKAMEDLKQAVNENKNIKLSYAFCVGK